MLKRSITAEVAFFCALGIMFFFAWFLPLSPDEASRIEHVKWIAAGKPYDFFWPPLSVLLVAINPFDRFDYVSVRLFNLLLTLPIFWLARKHLKSNLNWIPFLLITPYLSWVASSAMQQGLMLSLLGLLLYTKDASWWIKSCLMALCFSINPSLIAIVFVALVLLWVFDQSRKDLVIASVGGYILLLPVVAYSYASTGHFLPMLSSNGPGNLLLGNSPLPLSFRGVGDFEQTVAYFNLASSVSALDLVKYFALTEPDAFALNLLKKLVYFFSPTDYFRSDTNGISTSLLFTYIGCCQLIIYGLFLRQWRMQPASASSKLALALMVGAWLLYSAFFVKVRFRIPFDFLLFFSILPQLQFSSLLGITPSAIRATKRA